MPGAGGQLKQLYNNLLNGTTPASAASASGDFAAMLKYLVATIVGATDISPSADTNGSLAERIAYLQANSTGSKKVTGSGYRTAPDAANGITPTMVNSWGAGTWSEIITSTAAAIFIVGFSAGVLVTNTNNGYEFEVDIGTGAAASETVVSKFPITGEPNANSSTVFTGPTMYMLPYPIAVATSTRVAVRARRRSTGGTVSYIKLLYVHQSDLVAA